MEKEILIKKWLDNDLNAQELEAFKALDDYDALMKLSHYSKEYKAPAFDTETTLQTVLKTIETKKQPSKNWLKPFLRIAAVLLICLGSYYYTTTLDINYSADFAQKTSVELPDASSVRLNALSKISFNKKNWSKNRDLTLHGEAFFKVAKGSTFNVLTDQGKVTVLGTQFNVKQRSDYFEVTCYEGLVEVTFNTTKTKLKPGESFLSLYGKIIKKSLVNANQPSWVNNISAFKSIPLTQVLAEFERQYHVTIDASAIDTSQVFTGKFNHNNMDIAIKSIIEPLQLNYVQTNKTILLTRD